MATDSGSIALKRKVGEAVLVGTDVRVSVAQIRRNEVVLRFETPQETLVLREELLEEMIRRRSRKS